MRVRRETVVLGAVYSVIRLAGVVGTLPIRFADTNGYTALRILHPTMRTWPVAGFYWLVQGDRNRVIAQALVGAAAWTWFAAETSRGTRGRWFLTAAILAVGSAPQVTRYDNAILSESLTITVAVLLAAAMMRSRNRGRGHLLLLSVAWFLFVMVRPDHLVLGVVAGVAAFVIGASRRFRFSLVALLVMYCGVASLQQYRSIRTTRDLNLYTVLFSRVMADSATYAWFVEHDMPNVPGIRYVMGYDHAIAVPSAVRGYLGIPDEQDVPAIVRHGGMELATWVRTHGQATYATWLATHPVQNVRYLSFWADASLSPRGWGFLPTPHRDIVPQWMFGEWQWWSAAALTGTVALALVRRRREIVVICCTGAGISFLYATAILASAAEQQRHTATVAVMVRLLALASIGLAFGTNHDAGEPAATTV